MKITEYVRKYAAEPVASKYKLLQCDMVDLSKELIEPNAGVHLSE